MTLDLIKKSIKHGLFHETRRLIEKENIKNLMNEDYTKRNVNESKNSNCNNLPLMVMVSLIKDENLALNLSRLLIEKGYELGICDSNGLCAINYAIALKRHKLITLYLDCFNFELNSYRDIYKNSFLHYVYASNSEEVAKKFFGIYSKYYQLDQKQLNSIVNCDGLSVSDLINYFYLLKNQKNLNNSMFKLPMSFKYDSNPIKICKLINEVYNSYIVIKPDTTYLNSRKISYSKIKVNKNNKISHQSFDVDVIKQIKSFNKPRLNLNNEKVEISPLASVASPIKNHEHLPQNSGLKDILEKNCDHFESKIDKTWKSNFNKIFSEYSVMFTTSYRQKSAHPNQTQTKPETPMIHMPPINSKSSDSPHHSAHIQHFHHSAHIQHVHHSNHSNQHSVSQTHDTKSNHASKIDIYLVPSSMNKINKRRTNENFS